MVNNHMHTPFTASQISRNCNCMLTKYDFYTKLKSSKKVVKMGKNERLGVYRGNFTMLTLLESNFCRRTQLLHHFKLNTKSDIFKTSICCDNCKREREKADQTPDYDYYE